MSLRCQQIYFGRRRCAHSTFGDEEVCRWHKIAREFRADLKRTRGFAQQGFLYAAYGSLAAVLGSLFMLSRDPSPVWVFAAVYSLGWGATLLADAVMALDYPFSGLPFWAKLLAVGLAVTVVSGGLGSLYLVYHPEKAQQLAAMAGQAAWWTQHGPRLLVVSTALLALSNLKLLLGRILFVRIPHFGPVATLTTGALVAWAIKPYTQPYLPEPKVQEAFWQAAVGGKSLLALGVIWFITFNVAEMVNVTMRRSALDEESFKATIWPSYPVCIIAPWLGMLVARFALVWLDVQGAVPFGVAAALATVPFCILGTKGLLRWKGEARLFFPH